LAGRVAPPAGLFLFEKVREVRDKGSRSVSEWPVTRGDSTPSEPASDLGATQNVGHHGRDMKIPALKALVPTESVPPSLGTKVVVLLVFLVLGVLAAKRFSAEAGHAV
jgi:hypothetical protein